MRRAFEFDVLACPRCEQTMRLIALIDQPEVIRRMLRHLGHPVDVLAPASARAPPLAADADDAASVFRFHVPDEAESAWRHEDPC